MFVNYSGYRFVINGSIDHKKNYSDGWSNTTECAPECQRGSEIKLGKAQKLSHETFTINPLIKVDGKKASATEKKHVHCSNA